MHNTCTQLQDLHLYLQNNKRVLLLVATSFIGWFWVQINAAAATHALVHTDIISIVFSFSQMVNSVNCGVVCSWVHINLSGSSVLPAFNYLEDEWKNKLERECLLSDDTRLRSDSSFLFTAACEMFFWDILYIKGNFDTDKHKAHCALNIYF